MTCEEVRAELVECWGSTDQLSAGAMEHIEICPECRYEALMLRETHVMVRSLPQERAPEGFTGRVLEWIGREEAQRGWGARLAGLLTPARQPAWARAAAVGTALALAAAGGAVWVNRAAEPHATQQIVSGQVGTSSVARPAAAGEAELDELLMRHQAMEMTQPLADDAGVSLVVYTTN